MRRWILVLVGLSILAAALFWFLGYHPALMAAPGYALRNITDPGWLDGRVKTLQAIADQTPCAYQLLGWQETDALYYKANCDGTSRIWRYAVAADTSEPVAAAPSGLYAEPIPAADIVDGVLADVFPRELATVSRDVFIAGDALPAPDGRFTALVSRHVYGPQDVLLLSPAVSPSPTVQLMAATATAASTSLSTAVPAAYPAPATAAPPTAYPSSDWLPDTPIMDAPLELPKPPPPTRPPSPTPVLYPTPTWFDAPPQPPPPGLVYGDADGLWQSTAGEQKRPLWTRGNAAVSPDGRRALYQDEQTLIIADLTTGAESVLDLSGYDQWRCPVWGDDEIILLGTLLQEEEWEQSCGYLTAAALDGSWQAVLDPESKFGATPALSPDGRTIAYGGGRLVQLDGRIETFDPTVFTGFPQVENVGLGSPAWSPDGAKLAWYIAGNIGEHGDYAAAIAVFDLDAETAVSLHPYQNSGRCGWFAAPVWSPDGRWLAFNAEAEDFSQNGVWVVAADGSEEHFLGGLGGSNLVWSPDGQYLIYSVWNLAEQEDMVLMADTETWTAVPLDLPPDASVVYWAAAGETAVTATPTPLPQMTGSSALPRLSADGRTLVFTNISYSKTAVFVRELAAGTSELINQTLDGRAGRGPVGGVALSGNGRVVAYYSFDGNLVPGDEMACGSETFPESCEDLFIYDRDSDLTERIPLSRTSGLGADYTLALSYDGRYVAYSFYVYDQASGQIITIPTTDGQPPNGETKAPNFAGDGRYLAFVSLADNLVLDDSNETNDLFLWDRETGVVERISLSWDGRETDNLSGFFAGVEGFNEALTISTDGRYLAFASLATNLTPDPVTQCEDFRYPDPRTCYHIYLHDRETNSARQVTINADGDSLWPALSADGRFLVFASIAQNLTDDVWPCSFPAVINCGQLFLYDTQTGEMEMISRSADGQPGNGGSFEPAVSADGRFIAFTSAASNLVPQDANDANDIFLLDRETGQIQLVSIP